jgi:4-carboxymuconolactone decarboxylase
MADDRYERGREMLSRLAGEKGDRMLAGLEELTPDLARLVVEFGYGDVYTRGVLDLRQRQLAAISALTALGGAEPQLEYHVGIALNVGVTPEEIVETVIHCTPFVGFARALNAARAVRRAFHARGVVMPVQGAAPEAPGP